MVLHLLKNSYSDYNLNCFQFFKWRAVWFSFLIFISCGDDVNDISVYEYPRISKEKQEEIEVSTRVVVEEPSVRIRANVKKIKKKSNRIDITEDVRVNQEFNRGREERVVNTLAVEDVIDIEEVTEVVAAPEPTPSVQEVPLKGADDIVMMNELTAVMEPLPDFIIVDISWSPEKPLRGDKIVFSALVENIGSSPVYSDESYFVNFRINNRLVAWNKVVERALNTNDQIEVKSEFYFNNVFGWIPPEKGEYSISVHVDGMDDIDELFEENNIYQKKIIVNNSKGVHGKYYSGTSFDRLISERLDPNIHFDWGAQSPFPGLNSDKFSVRWNGFIKLKSPGEYLFILRSDDGSRLWLNDKLVISDWSQHGERDVSYTYRAAAGETVDFKLEYFEELWGASVRLDWVPPGGQREVVPASMFTESKNVKYPDLSIQFAEFDPPELASGVPFSGLIKVVNLNRVDHESTLNLSEDKLFKIVCFIDGEIIWESKYIDYFFQEQEVEVRFGAGALDLSYERELICKIEYQSPTKDENEENNIASQKLGSQKIFEQGINYSYYEGVWKELPNFGAETPMDWGITDIVTLEHLKRNYYSGLAFEGYFEAITNGEYVFYLSSDDGSSLELGGVMLITNDGLHGNVEQTARVKLRKGKHPIVVNYFQHGGGQALSLSFKPPGGNKEIIPKELFYQNEKKSELIKNRESPLDFFINDMTVSPSIIEQGSPSSITVSLGMLGRINTNIDLPLYLTYLIGGIEHETTFIEIEKIRNHYQVSFENNSEYWPAGTYNAKVILDSRDYHPELKEDNNSGEVQLQVLPHLPDLKIIALTIQRKTNETIAYTVFVAKISNAGLGPTTYGLNHQVYFKINKKRLAEFESSSIAFEPGEVKDIYAENLATRLPFRWFPETGTYDLSAIVDPRDQIDESNKFNNFKKVIIRIE